MANTTQIIAYSGVPKTGSITLVHLLRRHFGIRHVDCVDRRRPPGGSNHLPEDLRYDLRLHPWVQSIAGHGLKPFFDYEEYQERLVWYTMLRDPIARYISYYKYEVTLGRVKEDFEYWMDHYPRDNYHVRWLAGELDLEAAKDTVLRKMRAVGLLEHYHESLLIFRQRLGIPDWDLHYGDPRNVGKVHEAFQGLPDALQRCREEIMQRNSLDILLYEFVRDEVWPRQVADYGGSQKLEEDVKYTFPRANQRRREGLSHLWRKGTNRAYRNLVYKPLAHLDRLTEWRKGAKRKASCPSSASAAGAPKKLRVLLATPVPPPGHGGIGNWTRIVTNEFQPRQDLELIFVDTCLRYRGIPGLPRLSRLLFGSAQAIRDTFRVYRRMKADNPDLFHLNTSAGPATLKDILMLRIARRFGVPSVIHYQMGKALYSVTGSKLEWKLMRHAMALAHAVALGDKRSEDCVKAALPNQHVVTLPNFVETHVIDRIRNEENSHPSTPADCLKVVLVGFVVPRKGVRELVKACARLPDGSVMLDLVGPVTPAMRRELQSLASDSGSTQWLHFHGSVDHDQALRHMLKADLFVLPSHGETAPNAMLEAMGCGKAIVGSTVAAMPEMLDIGGPQECGVCVEPGNVDTLCSTLEELGRDEARRGEMGRKARLRAEKLYAVPVASAILLDFWKSVAK